jgi:succinate dehydrogenase/fumarate reductase cytochrome b subunit
MIQEPLPSIDVLFTLISWLLIYKSHDIVPNFQHLFPLSCTTAVSILSIEYLISGGNFQEFIKTFESLAQSPALWTSCKFMIALPFTYHCINGLRHLVRREGGCL